MTRQEQIDQAAKIVADSYDPDATWRGLSGEGVSGEDAARHLEAALAMVQRHGWDTTRSGGDAEPDLDGVDESSPVAMLRAVLRWLRQQTQPGRVTEVWHALLAVAETPDGDGDTYSVSDRCVDLVLRARLGVRHVDLQPWECRRGRTWDEVVDLVETAAAFAREHGPAGGGR